MPTMISSRVSTLPISWPAIIIENSTPMPRGAISKPGVEHRIAEQLLQQRRQQRQAGEHHRDADHHHEAACPVDEIAVPEQMAGRTAASCAVGMWTTNIHSAASAISRLDP